MKIRPLVLALAMAAPIVAHANLSQQVNAMFNGMINTTSPGAYKTATRGVVTGGGVVLRNRISTANIISITPPSAKAGCGGINLYTGSFSFINGEEFVALMRNVASNAVGLVSGFAFELALDAMDAQTAGVIRNLANKIQQLNQMFSNSCQLASGLVTNAYKSYRESSDLKAASSSFLENVSTDFFGAKTATESSPASRLDSAGKSVLCEHTGNIVWCGIKKGGLVSQYLYGSDQTGELVMSMVGSWRVELANDSKGGKNYTATPLPRVITDGGVKLLVEGIANDGTQIYKCDNNDCLAPSIIKLDSFNGLAKLIVDDLSNNQILEKIASNTATVTEASKLNYLAQSRAGTNLIKVVQKAGAAVGYEYLRMFAKRIAADAASSFLNSLIGNTEKGLTSLDMTDSQKAIDQLRTVRNELMSEYFAYIQEQMKEKDADQEAINMLRMAGALDNGKLPQGTNIQSGGA